MGGLIDGLIRLLAAQPPVLIYLVVGLGAAIENIFPPVPSDTFALFGAFLSARGRAEASIIFACVWTGNVGTAMVSYELSRRYGRKAFSTRFGRWILHPGQLETVGRFYARWGLAAIFFSRFIPAVRAVTPVFAGTSHMGFWATFLPLAVASAIWYAILIWIGLTAGRNWDQITSALEPYGTALTIIGAVLLIGIGVWWWKSRRAHRRADRAPGAAGPDAYPADPDAPIPESPRADPEGQ